MPKGVVAPGKVCPCPPVPTKGSTYFRGSKSDFIEGGFPRVHPYRMNRGSSQIYFFMDSVDWFKLQKDVKKK